MKPFVTSLLAASALFSAAPAIAKEGCEPRFFLSAQTVSVPQISVSSDQVTFENFDIRVRNASDNPARCEGTIRIARLSTSPLAMRDQYELTAFGRQIQILPNENIPGNASSDLPIAQLPSGANGRAIPFRLVIPSGWGTQSGSRSDDLLVTLVDEANIIVDRMVLTVRYDILPSAEVRVVGATGQRRVAQIDLGELDPERTNLSDPFGLRVWSTSPYTVVFRSQNNGQLIQEQRRGTIDYRLLMNGRRVRVDGVPAAFIPQGTGALGDFHRLLVSVPPFRSRAGEYSDRVEVTVTAS